uniref:Secreted protein n=1 Tax=Rhipicephalus appendiculatus TaxID=34631 RepID=A0A131YEK8_RHIAP
MTVLSETVCLLCYLAVMASKKDELVCCNLVLPPKQPGVHFSSAPLIHTTVGIQATPGGEQLFLVSPKRKHLPTVLRLWVRVRPIFP